MIKKLCTVLLSAAFGALLLPAQTAGSEPTKDYASFAPKKGQWEFSIMLGKGSFYNENTTATLIPHYTTSSGDIGLPNGSSDESGDLAAYLNIGGFNDNSLVNIIGIQGKYFIKDRWDVNLSAGMSISVTPEKNYIEPTDEDLENMRIPGQKWINAQATNNWYITAGSDYYFTTPNRRIHPYVGGAIRLNMARIETSRPYTGNTVFDSELEEDVDEAVFLPGGKAGQMFGFRLGAVAGIEYSLSEGLFLALECQPVAYRYDWIQICPQGFDKYNASHHNIKIIDMPMLKLGIRF